MKNRLALLAVVCGGVVVFYGLFIAGVWAGGAYLYALLAATLAGAAAIVWGLWTLLKDGPDESLTLPDVDDPEFRDRLQDERAGVIERRVSAVEKLSEDADAPLATVLASSGQTLAGYVAETREKIAEFEAAAETDNQRAAAAEFRRRLDAASA